MNYYNEIDHKKAEWLRELIRRDVIAPGIVDERSIESVSADDLRGYAQCHFFSGIGVWAYALRLAGWPDTEPVWTGSCPCQPFSAAGKRQGKADERHLWPAWFRLIRECRPSVMFAEQVASSDGLAWLDDVLLDMEGAGYACGPADLCAAGFGAPHIRQRLFIVAESENERYERGGHTRRRRDGLTHDGATGGPVNGFWRDAEWVWCRDQKYRPVEPGTFPLASGTPARILRLRGYGDSINAEVAAAFIRAYRAS